MDCVSLQLHECEVFTYLGKDNNTVVHQAAGECTLDMYAYRADIEGGNERDKVRVILATERDTDPGVTLAEDGYVIFSNRTYITGLDNIQAVRDYLSWVLDTRAHLSRE